MNITTEYHPTEADQEQAHYRVTVHRTTIGDNINISRERRELGEKYRDQDEILNAVFNFPLLRHASKLETFIDEQWQVIELTETVFYKIPELFIMDWLALVFEVNPQYSALQLATLKNLLGGLSSRNGNTDDSQIASATLIENSPGV